MRREAVSYVFVGGLFVACSRPAGGNVLYATAAKLDVSGESNASCELTLEDNGNTFTYTIAAPNPAVADSVPGTRAPLDGCAIENDASVVGVSGAAPACVRASRTSTQLCFAQDGCLGSPSTSDRGCPVTLTLTCGGAKLYDHVTWFVCEWLG